MPPPTGPQKKETRLWVTRHFPGKQDELEAEALEVRVFETAPATATVSVGRTINLGNYESIRLEVGIALPCYTEEVEEALETASEKAVERLRKEERVVRVALGMKK